jgi:hypothetical protein
MVMVPKPCLVLFRLLFILGGILWQGSGCVKGDLCKNEYSMLFDDFLNFCSNHVLKHFPILFILKKIPLQQDEHS